MTPTTTSHGFPQSFRLDGRVALVTGASRGIGEASAAWLRQAGAQVVLASRKLDGLLAAQARIIARGDGPEPLCHPCHVGKPDDVAGLVKTTLDRFSRIDILVNNAGTNPYFGPTVNASHEAYLKTFEINLAGPLQLARLVGQHLLDRNAPGSIINIASIGGLRAAPMQGIYGMTKAALISMTQTLSLDLGAGGIRVNAIAPGLIETRLASALVENQEIHAMIVGRTPLKRHGQPDEIASAVLFLAADASSFVTGHTLVVDGGMTIT